MRSHRRTAALAALALLGATAAVGCGAVDKAFDCARTANAVAGSVDKLRQAASDAAENPLQAEQALNDIDKSLQDLGDRTDDADLRKAVTDLDKAVDNVRQAIRNGDTTPDIGPVADAAGELGKVCTPG
ncbi:hypothetical protein [Streptomyces sp. URMC 123]|uniref:hypothetical protein n=1 Tax=Streptomyces sp. URMC 123 TaxID=3423403 RepID=UPI003F1DE034